MKIFSTLAIVSLAVAALAVETADATGHPVMKPVSLKKQSAHRPAKLVASDLNEGDEANTSGGNGDGLSDPFVGATFGVDDEAGPLVSSRDDSSSGSGESDGWNGSGSGSGVNEEGSFADEGSNEDSSMDGSGDADEDSSSDGSGVAAPATESSVVHHQLHSARHEESEWSLFDQESPVTSSDGSDGSNEDGESSSSGSNEDAEGSGSNGSNGSGEDTDADESPEEPIAGPAGFDGDGDLNGEHPHDGLKKSLAARQSEAAAKAAGQELATRASTESIGFQDAQRLAMIGSVVGAAIGAIAAVFGVVHLRRQQQRDEQSTLAAELPEPQTGREDGEFDDVSGGGEDELAASSIDLEEALTSEEETKENEEVEGTFV